MSCRLKDRHVCGVNTTNLQVVAVAQGDVGEMARRGGVRGAQKKKKKGKALDKRRRERGMVHL